MPDESKAPRTSQAIQQEYQQLAFRAGNIQYTIRENGKDLELINNQMRDLNFEFISVKKTEDAVAAAQAQAKEEANKPAEEESKS